MRVLTLLDYYLPGTRSGGPVRTLVNMVEQLPEVQFSIVSLDRDFGDSEAYPNVKVGDWNAVGPTRVFYAPRQSLHSLSLLRRLVREVKPQIVYLNSFFSLLSIRYLIARRLRLVPSHPVILAPRGEFSPGALGLKRRKKQLFIALAQRLGLYRDLLWQASSPVEAEEIRAVFGPSHRIHVAPDLTTPIAKAEARRAAKSAGRARFVFISRITPKKNLAFAIERLRHLEGDIELSIFGGIDEEAYWQRCQDLVAGLPGHVRVTYRGVLAANAVSEELRRHDFFLLPTLGENFGHAIFEALSAGCPPLISDQTPWRGLQDVRAGWDLPLKATAEWDKTLAACVSMSAEEYSRLSDGAVDFAATYVERSGARQSNLELFANEIRRR
jgi:glycosyltransferase involved in cell wall biosynthesis